MDCSGNVRLLRVQIGVAKGLSLCGHGDLALKWALLELYNTGLGNWIQLADSILSAANLGSLEKGRVLV